MKHVGNKLLHDLEKLRQSGKFGTGTLSKKEQTSLITKLNDISSRLDKRLKNPPQQCGRSKCPQKAGLGQDSFVLNVLFSGKKQTVANYYAATMLCASSFVEWCKQSISNGCLPGELLLRGGRDHRDKLFAALHRREDVDELRALHDRGERARVEALAAEDAFGEVDLGDAMLIV